MLIMEFPWVSVKNFEAILIIIETKWRNTQINVEMHGKESRVITLFVGENVNDREGHYRSLISYNIANLLC